MKTVATCEVNGKPAQETDFVEGNGWCTDLGWSEDARELLFVLYKGEGTRVECYRMLTCQGKTFIPPEQDQVLQHVRFPVSIWDEIVSVNDPLQMINSLFMRCLDLDDEYRFLLASFVMSTWVIDRLPVAPP